MLGNALAGRIASDQLARPAEPLLRFQWFRLALPGIAQPPGSLAQTHGQIDHGLQSLGIRMRQAIPMRQNQLRIAENSGERIIDFVPEYFSRVWRQSSPGRSQRRL